MMTHDLNVAGREVKVQLVIGNVPPLRSLGSDDATSDNIIDRIDVRRLPLIESCIKALYAPQPSAGQ